MVNYAPHYEGTWECGGIAPRILNSGSYSRVKHPPYPFHSRRGRRRQWSACGKRRATAPREKQNYGCSVRSQTPFCNPGVTASQILRRYFVFLFSSSRIMPGYVYINQREAQILVNNLYFFVKWLYMFRNIICPLSGATFNKLYSSIERVEEFKYLERR